MYLLVNVVERSEQLPKIMEQFAKIGITGSTVLDSTGMGRVLMKTRATLPVMQQINKVTTDLESSNKTVLTVIKEKDRLERAIKIVKSLCGDLNKPGNGILFTLSLDIVEGVSELNSLAGNG
jgi:nitrogen regulatory protein PII